MATLTAAQTGYVGAGETRRVQISFSGLLGATESLTGSPTATELTTAVLTISTPAVNSEALTINGVSVAAGRAIQFNVSGGTAGTTYRIKVRCGTDSTPAQYLEGIVTVHFLANT